jgi:hypothetical protein
MKQARPELQRVDETFARLEEINRILAEICNRSTGPNVSPAPAKECGSLYILAENTGHNQIKIDELDRRVSALEGPRTEPLPAISTQVTRLQTDIRIKEVAAPSKPAKADGRTYFDLVFYLSVQNGSECDERGLEGVEKVSYYLDPKWFTPSVVTTDERDDGFAYRVKVWGRTRVTACIYLKGVTSPVVRSDNMSFNRAGAEGGLLWGLDKSREGCAS